jgi:hypothetical protein
MRITEFNKQPTAKVLNESAAQMFGQKLNLDSFTLEQMLDARNKLRTKVSQFEGASNFNAVYEDETYGKNKMFLDVLNVAIEERESAAPQFTEMEELVLAKVAEGVLAFDEIPAELQEKAEIKARMYGAKIEESVITEGEEEKAELIMAARDMVDRITGWMEDTANMQAESMLELIDSIRDEMGSDLAMEFESMVKPSLATIYTALESSRQNLTQSVGLLTGENQDQAPMMGEEPPMDDMAGELPDEVTGSGEADEMGDDFGADAAAAGGEEAAGRMTRESVEYSRKLASLLAPKKK